LNPTPNTAAPTAPPVTLEEAIKQIAELRAQQGGESLDEQRVRLGAMLQEHGQLRQQEAGLRQQLEQTITRRVKLEGRLDEASERFVAAGGSLQMPGPAAGQPNDHQPAGAGKPQRAAITPLRRRRKGK